MSYFIVDVEADGPVPGVDMYSMVSFGVVRLDRDLSQAPTFLGMVSPISPNYMADCLSVSGVTRQQHLSYEPAQAVMARFIEWLGQSNATDRPVLVSDNPAFDWQFMNYYLHRFGGLNPFGYTARRIGDLCAGLERDFAASSSWKALRRTAADHHPLNDAMGNAEALLALADKHGLALPLDGSSDLAVFETPRVIKGQRHG